MPFCIDIQLKPNDLKRWASKNLSPGTQASSHLGSINMKTLTRMGGTDPCKIKEGINAILAISMLLFKKTDIPGPESRIQSGTLIKSHASMSRTFVLSLLTETELTIMLLFGCFGILLCPTKMPLFPFPPLFETRSIVMT